MAPRLVPERSYAAELMDRPDNPPNQLDAALADIRQVNRLLGGRRVLLAELRRWLESSPRDRPFEVLDVGTGGADLPLAMVRLGRKLDRHLRVTAIDLDPYTAAVARRAAADCPDVRVLRADARRLPFGGGSFDVVTASMFLHHFAHADVVALLRCFSAVARRAVIVNDLRRHLAPYGFIRVVASVTRRSPMFVHDAPLSVLRGFTAEELLRAARESGAGLPRLRQRWPYRLLLTLEQDHA